jgi:purine-binding chemotaxis protein CheW
MSLNATTREQNGTPDSGLQVVSFRVGTQEFGIPVLCVQDVLFPTKINRVPLAPPDVAGSLNLRGRIVTAIDMRRRLGLAERGTGESGMCVIVDCQGELYALLVDEVGDVLTLDSARIDENPVTLSEAWQKFADGLYQTDTSLIMILDIDGLLLADDATNPKAA